MTIQDKYKRSPHKTESENLVTYLCDQTFLKLWVYPNAYKESGKEFCDCLIIFENNILIFSVKEAGYKGETQQIAWQRWKRGTIEGSIRQIDGAERWLKKYPEKIFMDQKCTKKIPIRIDIENAKIYRFVIALGLNEDIDVLYSNENHGLEDRVGIFQTSKDKIYHILDSANVELILSELDTIQDFLNFYNEKELTISKLRNLGYRGESILLALYMQNMDENTGEHKILPTDFAEDQVLEKENLWANIKNNPQYLAKKVLDRESYIIDDLLNKAIFHEHRGELIGNNDILNEKSPIKEISKETRFQRRMLGRRLLDMYNKYWSMEKLTRFVRFSMIEGDNKAYVFLVNTFADEEDIENARSDLKLMLEIACGSLKNNNPELVQIIGLAFITDKLVFSRGEDYIILNCEDWDEEDIYYYDELNKHYRFWKKGNKPQVESFDEYPKL
jgi:hypothetical protein